MGSNETQGLWQNGGILDKQCHDTRDPRETGGRHYQFIEGTK